jgi:biotin transport system substrate-specific component
MILVSLFTSLTAVGAFISIPAGPVYITLQTLFVILSGILLGPKLGALSQIIYIILGLIGLPIFSGFNGGLQAIARPSFGFLIGFIIAAYNAGKITHNNQKLEQFEVPSLKRIVLACISSTIIIYIFGIPYMYFILNGIMNTGLTISAVLKLGFLLFIPGDILKIIVISVLGFKLFPIIRKIIYIN